MKFFLVFISIYFSTSIVYAQTSNIKKYNEIQQILVDKYGENFVINLKKLNISAKQFIYAAKLAKLGVIKLKNEDYGDALFLLNKAYKLVKSPNVLYYLAKTHALVGNYLNARKFFLQFKNTAKDWHLTKVKSDFVKNITTDIKNIESKLQRLYITVYPNGAEIYINGNLAGYSPLNKYFFILPGTNRIVVLKKGYVKKEKILNNIKQGIIIHTKIKLLTFKETILKNKFYLKEKQQKQALELKLWREYKRRKHNYDVVNKTGKYLLYAGIFGGITTIVGIGVYRYYLNKIDEYPENTQWKKVSDTYNKARIVGNTTIAMGVLTSLVTSLGYYFTQLKLKIPKKILNFYNTKHKNFKVRIEPYFGFQSGGLSFKVLF